MDVDTSRSHVPVSGSRIRSDPCGSWDHLLASSRPWFTTRVSLAGLSRERAPDLSAELARRFQTVAVPGPMAPSGDRRQLERAIRVHAAIYSALLPRARCVVISDSDPIAATGGAALDSFSGDDLPNDDPNALLSGAAGPILPDLVIVLPESGKIDFVRYDQYRCLPIPVVDEGADEIEQAIRDHVRKRWLASFRLGPYSVGQNGASPGQENR